MNPGWLNVKAAAHYSGVSERTMRHWLSNGLAHSRPLGGNILISTKAIDEFLTGFEVNQNQAETIVDEVASEMKKGG
jgi:excisionase family DNA binding protein